MTELQQKTIKELEKKTEKLIGKTYEELYQQYKDNKDIIDLTNKGLFGNVIENLLGVEMNDNRQAPDLECGIEIKAFSIQPDKKNGDWKQHDRLSLTELDWNDVIENDFYHSHLYKKCRLMFLVMYDYNKKSGEQKIMGWNIYEFDKLPDDLKAQYVKEYEQVRKYIIDGKAEQIHGTYEGTEKVKRGQGRQVLETGHSSQSHKVSQPNSDKLATKRRWKLRAIQLKPYIVSRKNKAN